MSPTLLNPPFRAEHVGSLLRPKFLLDKREALGKFTYSSDNLQKDDDEAVKYVVKMQRDLGMRVITDGEMRRRYYYDGVFENLEGMTKIPQRPMSEFKVRILRPSVDLTLMVQTALYPAHCDDDRLGRHSR